MRGRLVLLVAGLFILAGLVSMFLTAVSAAREAAKRSQCVGNLKQIGLALLNYHEAFGSFPVGTVANPALPPEQRLGWMAEMWNTLSFGANLAVDPSKGAFEAPNYPPNLVAGPNMTFVNMIPGDLARLVACPDAPTRRTPAEPFRLSYVGIAGVGVDAPVLPAKHPRAGVFGYDRVTRIADVTDGTANTMLVIETARDNRIWTAGGPASVRGVDTADLPHIGPGRPFGGWHPGGANVVFADGSVRFLRATIEPKVFEGAATIAGGEPPPVAGF